MGFLRAVGLGAISLWPLVRLWRRLGVVAGSRSRRIRAITRSGRRRMSPSSAGEAGAGVSDSALDSALAALAGCPAARAIGITRGGVGGADGYNAVGVRGDRESPQRIRARSAPAEHGFSNVNEAFTNDRVRDGHALDERERVRTRRRARASGRDERGFVPSGKHDERQDARLAIA